ERVPIFNQEGLQVRARVAVQSVEHLVELHRIRGLRDRDRVARGHRPGGRAAGLQFDEPVAFEEDARADLERRVGVDRQALRFDFHRHDAGVALTLDGTHLADVDAGDPHGGLRVDVLCTGEHALQLVAVFERDALGEAEVHDDDQHQDHDHAEAQRVGARQLRDGDRVAAAEPAPAAHFLFPFDFDFGFGLMRPRSLSVALGYFSPYRSCSRLVISRLLATPEGWLPIWAFAAT